MHGMTLSSSVAKEIARRIGERTQVDLAREVGVLQPALSRWLCGHAHPRRPRLEKFAAVLEVDPADLEAYLVLQQSRRSVKRPGAHREFYLRRIQPAICPRCKRRYKRRLKSSP